MARSLVLLGFCHFFASLTLSFLVCGVDMVMPTSPGCFRETEEMEGFEERTLKQQMCL